MRWLLLAPVVGVGLGYVALVAYFFLTEVRYERASCGRVERLAGY